MNYFEKYTGYLIYNDGTIFSVKSNKYLKIRYKKGYGYVDLCINGKNKTFLLHRLIADCFIDNVENKPCVNHIDGIKKNNDFFNLEWVTYKENMIHASKNNLIQIGEKHYLTSLNNLNVLLIRKRYKSEKISQNKLGLEFGVSRSVIQKIVCNVTWRNVSLILFIFISQLAFGQSSLIKKDSCICYTDNMDKKALECLINSPKKDSLISNYGLQIVNFRSVVTNQGVIISDLEKVNLEKDKDIVKLNLHLSRSRRLVKITGLAGVGIGVIGTVFLMK